MPPTEPLSHLSERGDIRRFDPQPYWHLSWTRSGRLRPGVTVPAGATVVNVVFAETAEKAPFYLLPRDVPRLWVTDRLSGPRPPGMPGSGERQPPGPYRILVVRRSDMSAIEAHRAYRYHLPPEAFTRLPHGEHVATEPVVPSRVEGPLVPLDELVRGGVELMAVEDLGAIRRALDQAGVTYDGEKLRLLDT